MNRPRGFTLVELAVVVFILLAMAAVALPNIHASYREAALLGAARSFKDEFMKARSTAIRMNTQTAIRFETAPSGLAMYATYIDGNANGVLSAEISAGIDRRIAGPFRLDAGKLGVFLGVLEGSPAPPPDSGTLSSEPIRFGRARMVSFSTFGTGTPGSLYLRTATNMAAVRVTPGSARVRIMILRGTRWIDRQG